jgi:hypothetical protein
MSASMRVLSPAATGSTMALQSRQPLDRLAGKVIGFIDNSKPNFNNLVDDVATLLVEKYGAAGVVKRAKGSPSLPAPDAVMRDIVAQCDAVVSGSGD